MEIYNMPTYPSDFLPLFFGFFKGGHFFSAVTNPTVIVAEVIAYILTAILLYHGIKKYGAWKILLFFFGSFLYTGLEENAMIYLGTVPAVQLTAHVGGTYFFNYNMYLFWFMAVPLLVCCSWFVVAYASYEVIDFLLDGHEGNKWVVIKAVLTGLLAMGLDLFIDPIFTRGQKWYWLNGTGEALAILSIPLSNFLGWFVLIACFAIYWKKLTDWPETRDWTVKRTVGAYIPTLFLLEFGTIILVGGLTILMSLIPDLWGQNFTIGGI